jgi:hypothetical protein
MKSTLKLQGDQMVVATPESEQKVKSAIGIGHFLTQRVVRPEKLKKLIAKEVHGASYTTLQANEASNLNLTDVYGHKSDAYFRFLVVGRADCLPTPAHLERWFAEEERELRGFSQDPDADFLDWGGDQQGCGTACLAARTRKAWRDEDYAEASG